MRCESDWVLTNWFQIEKMKKKIVKWLEFFDIISFMLLYIVFIAQSFFFYWQLRALIVTNAINDAISLISITLCSLHTEPIKNHFFCSNKPVRNLKTWCWSWKLEIAVEKWVLKTKNWYFLSWKRTKILLNCKIISWILQKLRWKNVEFSIWI